MKYRLIVVLAMILAATALCADTRRPMPRDAGKVTPLPEDEQLTGVVMRGVVADIQFTQSGGTADITVGELRNVRSQATNELLLEVWQTLEPPVFGEGFNADILGSFALPFVLQPGEARFGYNPGILSLFAPQQGNHYTTVGLVEWIPEEEDYFYVEFYTLPGISRNGPQVVLSRVPDGLVQLAGTSGETDLLEMQNVGTVDAPISISQVGNFFTISPSSFTIPVGGRQQVTITGLARASGYFRGEMIINGIGPSAVPVPVVLLSENPPAGIVEGAAITKRVDVAGLRGVDPSGQVTFTNNGTALLKGFAISDVAWLIPDPNLIEISPGGTANVAFTTIRALRPDPTAISATATLSLKYLSGTQNAGKTPFDAPPTLLAGVVVTDTENPETTASAVPPLDQNEVRIVIPGVGHVVESVGKEFISDLSLANSADGFTIGDLALFYSSAANSIATPSTALSANGSVNLADVVANYFGVAEEVGTIHVRSSSVTLLSVAANFFNKSNAAGTYGTAIPSFRTDRTVTKGQSLFINGLRQDANTSTKLFIQEMSGTGAVSTTIEFFDENGSMVGAPQVPAPVSSFTLSQLDSIVPPGAVSARLTVTSDTGSIASYATPVDAVTGDTWATADWAKHANISGSADQVIPVAGAKTGLNNSKFRTDASVTNTGTATGSVRLTYFANPAAPVSKTVSLGPKASANYEDIVPSFFQVSGSSIGWILVEPISGQFSTTSRTYTKQDGDPATFGTGVATLPRSAGLSNGEYRVFAGLEDTTLDSVFEERGGTFRTNVGLVEVSGQPATVEVSVSFADGSDLAAGQSDGSIQIPLAANQFMQLNGIVRAVIGPERDTDYGDLHGVQVRVSVVSGSGSVIPYATSTDNGTNDTVLRVD